MKLLIVVDFQKDFVDGSLGFAGASNLESVIEQKIRLYEQEGSEVIFTQDTHYENYLETEEGKHLPVIHCQDKSPGHEIYGSIKKLSSGKKIFLKETFGSLELANYLKSRTDAGVEYEAIELCGLVSNICVLANALMAKSACPNTPIYVDKNATASYDLALHEACLSVMTGLQIRLI